MSTGDAINQISRETNEEISHLFDTMDAVRAGKITPAEANAIARAASRRRRERQAQVSALSCVRQLRRSGR
jgi:hypothetical protein